MDFLAKLPIPDNKNEINQELQRFKQETEYVCLKLGVKDWMTFLTDVRTGNIVKKQIEPLQPLDVNTLKPIQLPFPERTKPQQQTFDAMFNDILESMSTKRSTGKQKLYQNESPICSQAGIRYVMGNQTERSQCSSASFPNVNELNEAQTCQKLIEQDKHDEKCPNKNEGFLQEVINNLDKYDGKKTFQSSQGFQTFRRESYHQHMNKSQNENQNDLSDERHQSTTKKRYNSSHLKSIHEMSEHDLSKIGSEEWIKQSIDQEAGFGMKEFLLALQNTKLRRQIKIISKMLRQRNRDE